MPQKRKKKSSRPVIQQLSDARYQKLLLILIEAWESADTRQDIFWDFGSGERPQKIFAEFTYVAKKEAIPVTITHTGSSLRFTFPKAPTSLNLRIKCPEGNTKAEIETSLSQ